MKTAPVLDTLTTLFLPSGALSVLARLILWCGAAALVYIGISFAIGTEIDPRRDLTVISLTVLPLAVMTLMTARHWNAAHSRLILKSTTDAMTGLMNRRAFFESIEAVEDGALLVVDVDHFKAVNDRYGHAVGDEVLIAVAAHLKKNIREGDVLGRIGGEEFGIFLIGADCQVVDHVGDRICRGSIVYTEDMPTPVKVTMSIGTAYSGMAPDTPELYRRADQALFQAKRSGRAKLNFWQPTFHTTR